ncbi:diaminopimelate epimerase [Helicobacter zhangjianzhongii]|uniref:diaminopimelate epimerase n=1 Tax=Helicobacter zhangjianzhongii TaxID=2974574 RepID=UPI002554A629|nr:diaminopimelate epimerase [Helicobacter sp. CPD2-1]MDL0080526.1 diaminopimelate epimerase [Helicobacter sp. CPD2-1]
MMILYKYCANGNDFLVFHTLDRQGDYSELARRVCDRHNGIGADGLVALLPFSDEAIAYQWDFYNADGSRANMCGNASRCVAHYAYNLGLAPKTHRFITHSSMQAQIIKVSVQGEIVSSNLGLYRNLFALSALPSELAQKVDSSVPKDLAATLLNPSRWHYIDTGVPHLVCFVQEWFDHSSPSLKAFMQELRIHFNANVNLAYASDEIYLATYERGVEDITLACGTGMAAVLLVGHIAYGLDGSAVLVPPSGDRLELWCESVSKGDSVLLGGDSACGLESQGGFTKQAENKTTASEKSAESKKVDSSNKAFLSSLRADLSAWQSTQKSTTPLESTFDKSPKTEIVFDTKAAGGRIFDEKAGLCSLLRGDKTERLSHKQKANSPLFREKPTPANQNAVSLEKMDSSSKLPTLAHINELESNAYIGDMEVFLQGEVRCVAVCQTC